MASFGLQTKPRLHCSCNIVFVLESFLSNVGIALGLYPPPNMNSALGFYYPALVWADSLPCPTFVPSFPFAKQLAAT